LASIEEAAVRLLAKVTIPMENKDDALESGALSGTMRSAMERIRPEASYFFEEDGKRACLFVFNLDLQSLLKPLFSNLDATVHVTPVMNSAEFERGLGDAQFATSFGSAEAGPRPATAAEEHRGILAEPELLADIAPGSTRPSRPGDGQPREARVEPRGA